MREQSPTIVELLLLVFPAFLLVQLEGERLVLVDDLQEAINRK